MPADSETVNVIPPPSNGRQDPRRPDSRTTITTTYLVSVVRLRCRCFKTPPQRSPPRGSYRGPVTALDKPMFRLELPRTRASGSTPRLETRCEGGASVAASHVAPDALRGLCGRQRSVFCRDKYYGLARSSTICPSASDIRVQRQVIVATPATERAARMEHSRDGKHCEKRVRFAMVS